VIEVGGFGLGLVGKAYEDVKQRVEGTMHRDTTSDSGGTASPSAAPAHCVLVCVVGGYFDHYLHHSVSRDGLVPVEQFFLPEKLALVLVRFHKQRRNPRQRSLWPPPPFPHLTGIAFEPRQLLRFPRSCTLLAAGRLATSPDSVWPPNPDCIDYIVMRVASGIVKKVKVRWRGALRGVSCACHCRVQ
jgi:hypothetical protein